MKKFLLLTALLAMPLRSEAQLPPIFAQTPREIVATKTLTEFPINTFLENIAVSKKGDLWVTSLEDGLIYRVSAHDGAKSLFAKIDGKIAGIAFDSQENLVVTGWAKGQIPSVFVVSRSGKVQSTTAIEGAIFLNGVTRLKGHRFLIADSYKGAIWEFDAQTKRAKIWLEHPLLTRLDDKNPFPAVNGLKIFRNTLYATNTARQLLLQIPLVKGAAGQPKIQREKINGDDFAFDKKGNLYLTTHVYNNVVKIAPDGKTTIIAENGAVTGDTSLAFGRGKNQNVIYVVTNGGMSLAPPEGVQTAKIVRLEVGAR